MRITEFEIDKYGPLANTGRIKVGNFNLFFGRNENGKTLTIDALIKFLLGKRAKDFKQTDRVEDNPDGYVKIALGGGASDKSEKTLPYDGDLPGITKSLPSPLTSSDCRNIFIIRNSELFLSAEADFYTKVTERLVGLRTSDLKKIKKNLMEIGKLTPAMDFKDDEKSIRLKSRIKKSEILINYINDRREKLLAGKYDTLEIDLYKKAKELAGINETITQHEDARKRILFEKSSELLSALESKINALKDMEIFCDEDFELWQECEREITRSEKELSELFEKAGEIKKEISGIEEQIKSSKQNLDILNNRKRQLDDERINLRGLEGSLSLAESDASLRIILKRISFISSLITLAIVISWFYNPSAYLYFAGILSLFITSILWIYEIYLNLKKRKALGEFKKIKLALAENRIMGDSIEDILNVLGKFYEDYEKARIRANELESGLTMLGRYKNETEQKLQEHKNLINDFGKKVFSLKTKSGFKALQEYGEILKRKRNKEKEKDGIAGRLEGMLEVHGKSMGETLNQVRLKIHELEPYREKGKGIEFNEQAFNDLKKRSKAAEEDLQKIKEKMAQFAIGMSKIEADANEVFIEDDEKLFCKTLIDLDEILNRLRFFIEENASRRNAISDIINIIDDIEEEENEKVLKLFESKDAVSVSGIFNMITDGYYSEVIYDRNNEGGILKAKRNNGELIDVEKLSGGAYDQLYLAVRLAIGEQLLHSEKGFFIMDDPFIKSDINRIERQMNALKKICDMGWQVLYFSCKNEIKDILSNDIKSGNINFVDIKWIN